MKKRICLYINEDIWHEFTSISRREGESASGKTEQFYKQYNEKHRVGNPQLRIDTIFGVKADHECYCGEKAVYEVLSLEKKQFYLCKSHFIQNRDARLLRKWRKLK